MTINEIKNMSCNPKIIREIRGCIYLKEMSLLFNEGVSIKCFSCYIFDELIESEKKYFDKSIVIPTASEKVVRSYNKTFKRILGKKKKKLDY